MKVTLLRYPRTSSRIKPTKVIGMSSSVSFKDFTEKIWKLPQEYLDELRRSAESFYDEPDWCDYDPMGMYIIGLLRHACSGDNLRHFYQQLLALPGETCAAFGFEKIPAYSTLAHFFNTRTAQRASELVDKGRELLEQLCAKTRRVLGRVRSTDGKKVESTHREAVFNQHYKTTLYKGLIDWDLELLVPLKAGFANGVADERPFARESSKCLEHLRTELEVLDGGYYGFEEYAKKNTQHYTLIYFPADENGSPNPEHDLLAEYRDYWKSDEYDIGADTPAQLKFLLAKGERGINAVGRYYRDCQIRESKEHPGEYETKKHRRSLVETGNSLLDNRGLASRVRHASYKQAERDLYWTCHVLQIQKIMKIVG